MMNFFLESSAVYVACAVGHSGTPKTETLPSLSREYVLQRFHFLLASSLDKEMVDILASLAEEASQPASQKTALSQSILLDQGTVES